MSLLDDYKERCFSLLNRNPAPTLAAGLVEIKSEEVKKTIAAILAVLSPTQAVIVTGTQIALATSSRPSSKKKWCNIHKWGYHSNKECKRNSKSKNYNRSEVDELEELDKEKDKYFASKTREMEEFRTQVEKFGGECRRSVEVLRYVVMELRSTFIELQGKSGCSNNSEIATAEMRKSELLGMKEKIERSLASNYDLRTQLQKQLQSILISQNQDGQRLLKQLLGGWVTLYGVTRLEREDIGVPKRKWGMSIIEQSVMMDYKHCRDSLPYTVASAILCIAQLPIFAILLRQLEL
ncbi:hypothetical protein RJ639_011520 [Escallonia herrerae]|uniref:Uncharacterized protein n=1 Tax=Escallonia herrerae TaxID=1293975 RepID=A0AA88VKU9_9ASTE|nr:hypothetical protein RJ639_011520 [Escallonia herrerae]